MKHFLIALLAIIVLCPKLYASLFPDKGSWSLSPRQLEILEAEEKSLYPIHLKMMEKKLDTVMKKRQKALSTLLQLSKGAKGAKAVKVIQNVLKMYGCTKVVPDKKKLHSLYYTYRGGKPYRDALSKYIKEEKKLCAEGVAAFSDCILPDSVDFDKVRLAEKLAYDAGLIIIWSTEEPEWSRKESMQEANLQNGAAYYKYISEGVSEYSCPLDFESHTCHKPLKIPKDIPPVLKEEDTAYNSAEEKIKYAVADATSLPVKEGVLKLIDGYAQAAEMGHRSAAANAVVLLKGVEQALRREGAWDDKREKMLYRISRISAYYEANVGPADVDVYPMACYAEELMKESDSEEKVKEMLTFLNLADQRLNGPYCIMDGGAAAYLLGMCHLKGIGISPNSKKAVYYFREGVIVGNANAARQLGLCYKEGNGVPKDTALGDEFLEMGEKRFQQFAPRQTTNGWLKLGSLYLKAIGETYTSQKGKEFFDFLWKTNASNDAGNTK